MLPHLGIEVRFAAVERRDVARRERRVLGLDLRVEVVEEVDGERDHVGRGHVAALTRVGRARERQLHDEWRVALVARAALGPELEAVLERVDAVERTAVRRRVVGRRARRVAELQERGERDLEVARRVRDRARRRWPRARSTPPAKQSAWSSCSIVRSASTPARSCTA